MKRLNALVMAGGRGERLDLNKEKPLLVLDGKYLIERVIEALDRSKYVNKIFVATSKHTEKTEKAMKERSIRCIRTPGRGYIEDMLYALKKLNLGKTLVVSADLPFLTSEEIDFVVEEYFKANKPSLAVMVPLRVYEEHRIKPTLSLGNLVPAGINVVDGDDLDEQNEATLITEKLQFAFNINTLEDLRAAEKIKRFKLKEGEVIETRRIYNASK